jgi:hypothetical protein
MEQRRQRVSSAGGENPVEDGHSWRKYGQKEILGAKHPRLAGTRISLRHVLIWLKFQSPSNLFPQTRVAVCPPTLPSPKWDRNHSRLPFWVRMLVHVLSDSFLKVGCCTAVAFVVFLHD